MPSRIVASTEARKPTFLGIRVAATNLTQRHVMSGFAFLGRTAGFDIVQHLIPYDSHSTFGRAFVVGLLNTILMRSCQ